MHAGAKQKSLVVVLGMHRSGTSAVARGLQAIGVDLGQNLMPPVPGVNAKGFFEDVDINALNIEMLQALGVQWHSLAPVPAEDLLDEKHTQFRIRAVELLGSKLQSTDCFGVKDPRLCRLLPFWQEVFKDLQLKVSYVIVVRNPISVALSLERVHRLPQIKSHFLWVEHILSSIMNTQGKLRVLVDYDKFMDEPESEIIKIAQFLSLDDSLNKQNISEYCCDFLDNDLRHTLFSNDDVSNSADLPVILKETNRLISDILVNKYDLDKKVTFNYFNKINYQMTDMFEAFKYILTLDNIIDGLNNQLSEKKKKIIDLEEDSLELSRCNSVLTLSVAEYDNRIGGLSTKCDKQERLIEALKKTIGQRDAEVDALVEDHIKEERRFEALQQTLAELDDEVAQLEVGNDELRERIVVLEKIVAERDADVAALSTGNAEQRERIDVLEKVVAERDADVAALSTGNAEQRERIDVLEKVVAERDADVAALSTGNAEQREQIDVLEKVVAERDSDVAALSTGKAEQRERIAELERTLDEWDGLIANLYHELSRKESDLQRLAVSAAQFSYRLNQTRLAPEWKLRKFAQRIKQRILLGQVPKNVGLVPYNHLQRADVKWVSTGEDPQFLLVAERAWHGLTGWHWLELESFCDHSLNAELYFDVGTGFIQHLTIRFQLSGQGHQIIPLYIPFNCHAIRLDPCNYTASFKMSRVRLIPLRQAPRLPDQFLPQAVQYEALGGREGNIPGLKPIHQVSRHNGTEYCWQSVGEDPWFLLEGYKQNLVPGWCRVELRISANIDRGNAKLYLDYDAGFNEADSVHLPFTNGQKIEVFTYFNKVPRQIRLDPFDCSASFSIENLALINVSEPVARRAMLKRIGDRSSTYLGLSSRSIWRSLCKQSRDENLEALTLLASRYMETFPTRWMCDAVTYADWIAKCESPVFSDLAAIVAEQETFANKPVISVVMPVYNTPEKFLRKAVESVVNQSYVKWELCVADDASTEVHIRPVLQEYAEKDPRIKLIFRAENGHISVASNSALTLATGKYVALLDHDDELSIHALHFMAAAVNRNQTAEIFYSDEDKIDAQGNRSDPHFKSQWNPDLILSQNYVSHLGVYRRELLQKIGGFRVGVEGCQDHDLLLRCLPYVEDNKIVHIPKVLYHWRILEGSTALNPIEKTYTTDAGIKVLSDYFVGQGRADVKVETGMVPNTYRVRYPIPEPAPMVSLLIPTRDRVDLLEPCINSILEKTNYRNYEILILDNQSEDAETHDFFKRIQTENCCVKVLAYQHPFNFSAINNFGVKHAAGEVVGLINNDVEIISPDWLNEMASHALRPEIGCVGAKLYYSDNTVQHAGVILGIGGIAGHSHKYYPRSNNGYFSRLKIVQNLSAVTAACLLIRKEIYEQVGGLDDVNLPVAFNDVDFCLKVRSAGYLNLWTPYATLYHYESKSRGAEDSPEKIERFRKEIEYMKSKWGNILKNDPYYNENLTLKIEDFSIVQSDRNL